MQNTKLLNPALKYLAKVPITIIYPPKYRGETIQGAIMEESLCNVEFLKGPKAFIARVQSDLGGMREYRSESFEEVLEQIIIDLQEEFETQSVQQH